MAPRIANDCFADEFLTVDYDTMAHVGIAPPPGGGGMGGGVTHDVNTDQLNLDNDGGAAAAAATAAAMADAELDAVATNAVGTQTANMTAGGVLTNNGNEPTAIENDPLSMGQPAIARSHSSTSGSDALMQDGIMTGPSSGTMGTTVTVTMAQAAQVAWDQFVAGQEVHQFQQQQQQQVMHHQGVQVGHHHHQQAVAMEGLTINSGGVGVQHVGGSGSVGGGGYSPSSIPQATSPSASFGSPPMPGSNDTTPTTYQQLLLQQHRQDMMSVHSAPASGSGLTSSEAMSSAADRMSSAQQRGGARRVSSTSHNGHPTGRHVPRASSFGGFPTPPGASSRGVLEGSIGEGAPLAPALEELQDQIPHGQVPPPVATVSRSNSVGPNSVASSLTGSGSVHNSANSASSYQRFLSCLQGGQNNQASSPLETIPPSDVDESSPQETYGSIHSTSEFSSPASGTTPGGDSKMSPGESSNSPSSPGSNGNSFSHSPKLPYSPSLLDQTSFPEDGDDLSVDDGDDDEDEVGDKYSPISKLDWGNGGQEDKGMDITSDTADTTMEEGSPVKTSSALGLSLSLASHVIHEESAMADVSAPLQATLRPRPSPFARANSTSGISSSNSGTVGSNTAVTATPSPQGPRGLLVRNEAFELSPVARPQYRHQISDVSIASNDGSVQLHATPPPLSFGSETTISDLTYYAEKGCIVDVLAALTNPHLKTLGSRMLADYAKMPHRRVAVASNTRILEFVQCTAREIGVYSSQHPGHPNATNYDHVSKYTSPNWLGREYAVETVRSLTAAEENDRYLMNAPGLLKMLALVARGGPFVQHVTPQGGYHSSDPAVMEVPPPTFADNGSPGPRLMMDNTMGVASDKARLHACIAIMNLSCGKSNKVEITSVKQILEGMRDVMLGRHFAAQPRSSLSSSRAISTVADEARLKATTCIKNLSNADANDAALLGTSGLVETLGYVAEATCHPNTGATTCTTHACLALMNLSISKVNKNTVFRTPGVMDALMSVIIRTAPKNGQSAEQPSNTKDPNFEARVKACSALSNLAIGYDNKIPMFNYPGFVESILKVIRTDRAEARTKACSILWSFAAEMKNQVPVVQRGDILPALVSVAKEDTKTEARFKCVAALTLLAESPENAVPLLRAGSLEPLMNVLQEAGPDPTQWRGQTASWCVGFLMNMAQCDDVVPALLQEGIVDLLAPLLSLDHYQSLKAAMAVTFVCQYDTGDKTYNLLRQTENVIPKIVGLLHNTLSGRGGSGYKYGVFTLRSSVGCIASLAAGPDFMKERIATNPVFESLLKVVEDFCVDGGTPGAIVGGGKDDTRSVTLAVRALSSLIGHLIPEPNCAAMPFGPAMDDQLITALRSFEQSTHPDIDDITRKLAYEARIRVEGGKNLHGHRKDSVSSDSSPDDLSDDGGGIGLSLARKFFPFPCGMNLHVPSNPTPPAAPALPPPPTKEDTMDISDDAASASSGDGAVRTFLLTDTKTGRRFAVPRDPSGGRQFNDNRVWCFRRGRYCNEGELPDSNFQWSDELQAAYMAALNRNVTDSTSQG